MERLQDFMVAFRRDLHKHAEPGWFEFRTSSRVAERLAQLGYKVGVGREIIEEKDVMGRDGKGVPAQVDRALRQGAQKEWIDRMAGFTGVLAVLDTGRPGPVISLRFDLDAVEVNEVQERVHRPFREGFSSVNPGVMHACGHDGHTAMGLGLASVLMGQRDSLKGVIKLIFQPAEEGVRGAKAIVGKGILDDSDFFLAVHLGMGVPTGRVVAGVTGFLCTTKFDVEYRGCPAHAGAAPNEGCNALLAAANAALNLHAIAPHREGISRVNVGVLSAGEGRNVVPSHALLKVETRGQTDAVASYMFDRASTIVASGAAMYGVEWSLRKRGESTTARSDESLVELVAGAALKTGCFAEVGRYAEPGGSDDAAWMMRRVQERGGRATYILLGADIAAGHHNGAFDFDESVLFQGVGLLDDVIGKILSEA